MDHPLAMLNPITGIKRILQQVSYQWYWLKGRLLILHSKSCI
jgi:hypothetical protein